jgi:hypothetical protein
MRCSRRGRGVGSGRGCTSTPIDDIPNLIYTARTSPHLDLLGYVSVPLPQKSRETQSTYHIPISNTSTRQIQAFALASPCNRVPGRRKLLVRIPRSACIYLHFVPIRS